MGLGTKSVSRFFSISSGDTGETHARRCHDARSEIGGTWEGFEYLLLLLVPEGFGSGKGSGIISEPYWNLTRDPLAALQYVDAFSDETRFDAYQRSLRSVVPVKPDLTLTL